MPVFNADDHEAPEEFRHVPSGTYKAFIYDANFKSLTNSNMVEMIFEILEGEETKNQFKIAMFFTEKTAKFIAVTLRNMEVRGKWELEDCQDVLSGRSFKMAIELEPQSEGSKYMKHTIKQIRPLTAPEASSFGKGGADSKIGF